MRTPFTTYLFRFAHQIVEHHQHILLSLFHHASVQPGSLTGEKNARLDSLLHLAQFIRQLIEMSPIFTL